MCAARHRLDGVIKLIKIHRRGNKYGFVQPCRFNSVPEIIKYFEVHSLKEYNRQLDVKLSHPVCWQVSRDLQVLTLQFDRRKVHVYKL